MTLTELDPGAVRSAFDRAARSYDGHAVLQHEVEQRLLERLDDFDLQPRHVLDVGCGTGIGSHALAARYPEAQVVALDWSGAMLRETRRRAAAPGAPHPVCADMHRLPLAPRRFDLVFSNLAVQWSMQPIDLFRELRRVLRPRGLLLFTTFGPQTLFELRESWRAADPLPHVNDFRDILETGDQLVAAGFQEPVLDVERMVLNYRDVMTLMRELKAIGAHNSARQRPSGLTGKGKLQRVLDAYQAFRQEDVYPASYEVVFGATFAPAEGQPVRAEGVDVAEFSVDSLRRRAR